MEKVEFNSLIDPHSILVLNQQGRLRKLYCPFKVKCIKAIEGIAHNSWCYVDRVTPDSKNIILYSINGNLLPYWHFHIYITF